MIVSTGGMQGHTCVGAPAPAAGLPLRWQAALVTLLTLAVMFAGLSLVRAAMPSALFFAFLVWSNLTKGVIEAYDGTVAIVRNWAVSCGGLILFLSYLLPMKTPAAFHAARAAGAILLAIGALIARSKLRHWLAAPGALVSGAAGRQSASAGDASDRVNLPSGVDDSRRGQPQQQSAQIVELPLTAEPQPEDWNASRWDPEVQEDIERRRRRGRPTV